MKNQKPINLNFHQIVATFPASENDDKKAEAQKAISDCIKNLPVLGVVSDYVLGAVNLQIDKMFLFPQIFPTIFGFYVL